MLNQMCMKNADVDISSSGKNQPSNKFCTLSKLESNLIHKLGFFQLQALLVYLQKCSGIQNH